MFLSPGSYHLIWMAKEKDQGQLCKEKCNQTYKSGLRSGGSEIPGKRLEGMERWAGSIMRQMVGRA